MDKSKPPGIRIGQVFLEETSFKHRPDYLSLPPSTPAQVGEVSVAIRAGVSQDELHGLVHLRIITRPENKPLYDFEITMCALFDVDEEAANLSMSEYVSKYGPALLYPFARQVVADITGRGRFGSVWLSPINLAMAAGTAPKKRVASKKPKKKKKPAAKKLKRKGRKTA